MLVHVTEAKYLGEFRVLLTFNDGLQGEVNLADDLWGEVFEPLRDPAVFATFVVDRTLTWLNGADFAPEFLYERIARGSSDRAGPGS